MGADQSLYGGYSLARTILHEMGHVAGVGDMGGTCDCHGEDYDPNIVSPQLGDKQGVVYSATDLSSGFPAHDIILGDRTFSDGLTIPAGRLAVVRYDKDLLVGPGESIDVYGTLQMDPYSKIDRLSLYFSDWNNLNVHSSGTLNTSNNNNIDHFTNIQIDGTATFYDISPVGAGNNVTIDSDQSIVVSGTLQLGPGTHLNVNGDLTLNSGALITKVPGMDGWDGIFVNNGGEMWVAGPATIENSDNWSVNVYNGGVLDLDSDLTIQNSLCGLTLETGSDFQPHYVLGFLHFKNCTGGLRVYYNSDFIHHVYFEDCTRAMYIQGYSSYPDIEFVTVEDMETYGMIVSTSSSAFLSNSFFGPGTSSTWPYNTWLYYGAFLEMHNTDIYPRVDGYAVNLDAGIDSVYATNNYWGDPNPVWSDILSDSTKVNYSNYRSTPYGSGAFDALPGKAIAAKTLAIDVDDFGAQLETAIALEHNEKWDEAAAIYRNILANTKNSSHRRPAIMALLRVIDHSTKNYTEFREIIREELRLCSDVQKSLYENLLCELNVKEGNYQDAVNTYEQLLPKYDESEVGVEILTRLAKLYGDQLNDKAKAREYADRAAAINPGQLSLEIAFAAAGIKYDPFEFTDVFRNHPEPPEEKPDELNDKIVEFIANSPNPFNPATTFSFAITTPGKVRLSVCSITGHKIATLVDEPLDAGTHSARFDGSSLASGIYFYRFESPGFKYNGKMLLVK